MDFSIAELCSGIGGLGLGIRLAVPRARTVVHVEREITAVRILASRMREGFIDRAPIWTDLRTFDGRQIRNRVHCLAAGYPCQPFSHVGKRCGDKDPRHLFPDICRIVDEANVPIVFFENVEGHLSLGFREVAGKLRKMGFEGEAGIFSAQEVGGPHLRKRLFILAYRASGGLGILRESSRRSGFFDGRGPKMADSVDGFIPLAWRESKGRTGPRSTGPELADTRRSEQLRRPADTIEAGIGCHRLGKHHRQTNLSDAAAMWQTPQSRDYRSGKIKTRATKSGISTAQRTGAFPPGPDEIDEWRELLRHDASLKPALCRASDESAYWLDGGFARTDRLRSLGNGVVPLTAAFAFVSLATRILKWNSTYLTACRGSFL